MPYVTESHECDYCGTAPYQESIFSADDDGEAPWACASCYASRNGDEPSGRFVYVDDAPDAEDDGSYEAQETTDDEVRIPSSPLALAVLPNRPARLLSFEQEVGRGGNYIAEQLHLGGFASDRYVHGYHHRHEARGDMVWVEEDGSVAAEVIWSKLDLTDANVARRFEDGLEVIRNGIRGGEVKLDMRCGLHIHVGLGYDALLGTPAYGSRSVESLYHLWNHLEDTMYRLASANWRCHRTEVAESNYAPPTRKGLVGVTQVGDAFQTGRGALNLSNYLSARGECNCGAFRFAAWEECVCELRMPTVEFRVFNASANKRKLRAYGALCLAMVAYAEQHKVQPNTHPVLGWERATELLNVEESKQRLAFILDELPMTREERLDVVYCAEKSSLREVVDAMR